MYIEGKVLRIYPLSLDQLHLLNNGRHALSFAMGWNFHSLSLPSDHIEDVFEANLNNQIIPAVEKNADNYLLFTHWIIYHCMDNKAIGGFDFQILAKANNSLGLSLYLDTNYQQKNIVKEVFQHLKEWLAENTDAQSIYLSPPSLVNIKKSIFLTCGFSERGSKKENLYLSI